MWRSIYKNYAPLFLRNRYFSANCFRSISLQINQPFCNKSLSQSIQYSDNWSKETFQQIKVNLLQITLTLKRLGSQFDILRYTLFQFDIIEVLGNNRICFQVLPSHGLFQCCVWACVTYVLFQCGLFDTFLYVTCNFTDIIVFIYWLTKTKTKTKKTERKEIY